MRNRKICSNDLLYAVKKKKKKGDLSGKKRKKRKKKKKKVYKKCVERGNKERGGV